MKIVAFFDLLLSKEKGLSYHLGQTILKINKNVIFSEFLKIIKNTLALIFFNVINNTHHLFVVVPKIATQSYF